MVPQTDLRRSYYGERPSRAPSAMMTIRLTDAQADYVRRNAASVGVTTGEVIRFLIDKGITVVEGR